MLALLLLLQPGVILRLSPPALNSRDPQWVVIVQDGVALRLDHHNVGEVWVGVCWTLQGLRTNRLLLIDVAGVSLALALMSWLMVIIGGDVMIGGWVMTLIETVLMSVLWCCSPIVRWSGKVLLNVISPMSFKPGMITCDIGRADDINRGFGFVRSWFS
jgi:hypothetical protein